MSLFGYPQFNSLVSFCHFSRLGFVRERERERERESSLSYPPEEEALMNLCNKLEI
jgi:hypothetical protein